ncbi:MAG: hypothetical protein KJ017_07445 [Alphaproteobacteria bacterium]|nr:hypothetical protein [Alphaproteobacteria bacterium]
MTDEAVPPVEVTPEELRAYVMDLQEGLAYLRAALGLDNDFPTYTRERGQEILDAIDLEIRNSPDDLSPEEMQDYLFERFSENVPHELRVQLYSDPTNRAAFLNLFRSAPTLVAQVNALHFGE